MLEIFDGGNWYGTDAHERLSELTRAPWRIDAQVYLGDRMIAVIPAGQALTAAMINAWPDQVRAELCQALRSAAPSYCVRHDWVRGHTVIALGSVSIIYCQTIVRAEHTVVRAEQIGDNDG